MAHLGPENVRRQFKGMVERCADCGFDLAGGQVEVVPTAHYLMGGVEFASDCTTELPGLFVAGEDSGGVHGANRLGGNGVANSTVFGGIAGVTMARWLSGEGARREPDPATVAAAIDQAERPFAARAGNEVDLALLREGLYATMWDDAGIVRNAESLARAEATLAGLQAGHQAYALPSAGRDRGFNLAWHDWLNLGSLMAVSRVIVRAARARENSRGAHYRDDYPDPGDLARSTYTRVRLHGDALACDQVPVRFTRVSPGQTLVRG
jgi:fumarate reductase flavoprotein subunit